MEQALAQSPEAGQRIRGKGLAIFFPKQPGATMHETIRRTDEARVVLASNARLSALLSASKSEVVVTFPGAFACRTGTLVGYIGPGQQLSDRIAYQDPNEGCTYMLPVPAKYRGMKDVAIVIEHPDYSLRVVGRYTVVQARDDCVSIVERFPAASEAWYHVEPVHGIPISGKCAHGAPNSGFLWRAEKSYVGLVVRGFGAAESYFRHNIDISFKPGALLGALMEC